MANHSEHASDEDLLRPIQVQKQLGVVASTLWNYVHRGLITPVQRTPGGHARYRKTEVAALRAQLSTTTEAPVKAVA
jgi:DNA-binding transcriptional MerR regulator